MRHGESISRSYVHTGTCMAYIFKLLVNIELSWSQTFNVRAIGRLSGMLSQNLETEDCTTG